jgi:predicted Zn-dependent protease
MPDATSSLSPVPDEVAAVARGPAGRGRAPARWILTAVSYCRRRPARALGLLLLGLIVAVGLAAGFTHLWFEHHLRAAQVAVDRGHNTEAIRHLVACRKVRPAHPEVLILMARVAFRTGQPDKAERILDEYWAEHGDDESLVFERLRLRAARGELETAAPALIARIRADGPDTAAAREALVTGLINRFRWAEAILAIEDWLAHDPDNTTALLLRGKLDEQKAVTDLAAASYRRVLEIDPDHDEARLRLATVLLQGFYGEEALGHLERLRERLPDNPEVAYQRVVALGLQGRTAEAREALDALLREYPTHAGALAERGKYAALDRDDAAAADYFGRSIRLDPGNLAARHQHAQALVRLGNVAEATRAQAAIDRLKSDLNEIDRLIAGPLQATPNDPAIHHQIALIALRAGQPKEGLRWLQSAIQVDPDHLPSHQTLAGYYNATGNPVLAARHRAIAQRLAGKQ